MATTSPPVTAPAKARFQLPAAVSVLAERDFRVVWTGNAISMVGTWMQAIAQGLLVLSLWDSPVALGIMTFANAVPTLLVMLFGGVLADRADKRRILLVSQMAMAVLAGGVGLMVLTDLVQFWMVVAATIVLGVVIGYDMPAYQAFLPEMVPPEKISQVVALASATFHGSRMIGPALAGGVIAVAGIATAYLLNAASFLAVIFGLLIVRYRPKPPPADATRRSAIEDLRAGIQHARGRSNLQVMLMLTALNTMLLFPAIAILSPYYVTEVLDRGAGVLGMIWAMSGVGSLIGALALVWWPTQMRAGRIAAAVVIGPLGLIIMALTREPVVAILASGLSSISFSSQLGLIQSMIQESTPQAFRGRVMSLNGIAFNGTMPFAAIASSSVALAVGLPTVMIASSLIYVVIAALMLRFAGGGIGKVVRDSAAEYEVVAAAR